MFKKPLIKSLLISTFLLPSLSFAASLTAGGSTAIYPVISKWAKAYEQKTTNQINYQPVGSGGGINGLNSKTFAFAASDMPLTGFKLFHKDWMQFPAVVSGIVMAVNLPGIDAKQLVLSGPVIADIYQGKVIYWDNAEIKTLNKNLKLPHRMIITVHRADGSGTTYNFSNYLSKVSKTWKKNIGYSTVISWPGMGVGAKGNAGVAAQVENIQGSMGYVEYAYAVENNMSYSKMINKAGKVVTISPQTIAAAAKNAQWQKVRAFNLVLTNQPGAKSWPLVATTFILLPKKATADTKQAVQFFNWALTSGQEMAKSLDYVPMPNSVVSLIMKQWQKNKLS